MRKLDSPNAATLARWAFIAEQMSSAISNNSAIK
jgi:hypothetical protein